MIYKWENSYTISTWTIKATTYLGRIFILFIRWALTFFNLLDLWLSSWEEYFILQSTYLMLPFQYINTILGEILSRKQPNRTIVLWMRWVHFQQFQQEQYWWKINRSLVFILVFIFFYKKDWRNLLVFWAVTEVNGNFAGIILDL